MIGSTTIFRLVPPDMEVFESALLWKRLRYEFSADILWEGQIAGVAVRVSGRRADQPELEPTQERLGLCQHLAGRVERVRYGRTTPVSARPDDESSWTVTAAL